MQMHIHLHLILLQQQKVLGSGESGHAGDPGLHPLQPCGEGQGIIGVGGEVVLGTARELLPAVQLQKMSWGTCSQVSGLIPLSTLWFRRSLGVYFPHHVEQISLFISFCGKD